MTDESNPLEAEETKTAPSTADAAPAHLANLQFRDLDEDDADPDAPIDLTAEPAEEELEPAEELIGRDEFFEVFKIAFAAPGMVDADFEPLAIAEREERGARKASDAMYRLLEIYYPAALTPGGETMANLLILAPFLIGKVRIAAAVIRDKRRPREEAPEEQESRAAAHPRIVVDNGPKEAGDGVTDNWYVDGLGGEVERQ